MTGWQWHQLDHMQIIYNLLQTDNYASTSSLNFLPTRCSSCFLITRNDLHKVARAEAYLHAKYHLAQSSGLARGGERGPHLTQSRLGRDLVLYQVAC